MLLNLSDYGSFCTILILNVSNSIRLEKMQDLMQKSYIYADEADLLNVALFGQTAKEWRDRNPDKEGNIRDYADLHQLLVLSNLESYNAILIVHGVSQENRLELLRETAEHQLRTIKGLDFKSQKLLAP